MLNNSVLKGNWNEVKGDVKRFFGKLTDDDLMRADGDKDKLLGALQKRYGYSRDDAELRWEDFTDSLGNKWDKVMNDMDSAVDRTARRISNDN